jgi:hypothetical protein
VGNPKDLLVVYCTYTNWHSFSFLFFLFLKITSTRTICNLIGKYQDKFEKNFIQFFIFIFFGVG